MEPFETSLQIHVGAGLLLLLLWVLVGKRCSKLCSQTSGNASISSDMMRTIMDGSHALFGN